MTKSRLSKTQEIEPVIDTFERKEKLENRKNMQNQKEVEDKGRE